MRAIVLSGPGRVDTVDTWPEPRPREGEVLVAMRAVGLCGSDLGVYDGHRLTPEVPWVMGHEGGGEIVAVGPGVTGRYPGQRVVVEPNYGCRDCAACAEGVTSACAHRGIVGMNIPGLLAERVAVPAQFTWPVPDTVDDAALACVEPLAVARAAVRRSGVGPDQDCLVVGAGSQGLFVCQALRALGVRPRVTEPHAGRLALAEELGATPADPESAGVAHVVFDTVGVPDTWDLALRAVRPAGSVVVIGMSGREVSTSTLDLTRRQLTIRGSLIYDHPHDFRDTVDAVVRGALDPARVLRYRAGPDAAADAFAGAREV
ncbi:zinc-dependent alcohol dehydrogenase, partial [Saccharomonospora saliphila]|uniref:zinc-dependent alcohol dehydrogenase n=1 Tax=Saccharomonospora saliphila TaxID=369829 RepID=UPI0003701852